MSGKTSIAIILVIIAAVVLALFVARRVEAPSAQQNASTTNPGTSAGIANPASVNCVQKLGGQLELASETGGAVGYCHLPDGRVCEEWSLMRGGCMTPSIEASLSAAKAKSVGTWKSTQDSKYTLQINADGSATELYAGDSSATATGTWTLFTSGNPDSGYQGPLSDGTIYAKLDENGDVRYFSVIELSTTTLQLSYLARGNTLEFTRVQ